MSSFAACFVWFGFIGAVLMISAIYYGNAAWIDLLYYTSSIKLIVDFIKYLPQVWLNFKRQSAQGLSLQYICLVIVLTYRRNDTCLYLIIGFIRCYFLYCSVVIRCIYCW